MASSEIILEAVSSVSQIPAADWDACANPRPGPGARNGPDRSASPHTINNSCTDLTFSYNPFVSHAFFLALEASGSACARTGWGPRHLLARRDGAIAGIVPCFLKSHSQGEYVFDRGWADAYERAGGRHYDSRTHRQRHHRRRVGRLLRLLHADRFAKMGPALPGPQLLFADRRKHGRGRRAHHGQAQRSLDRRRHQFHRLRYAVWPQLGRDRTSPVSAFRGLLLPGHGFCDPARPENG